MKIALIIFCIFFVFLTLFIVYTSVHYFIHDKSSRFIKVRGHLFIRNYNLGASLLVSILVVLLPESSMTL